jgi:two-component system LytT family sensor kinase
MKRGGSRQLTLLQWVLVFGVWTLIGLTFGAQLYLAYSRGRQHISWTKALFLELTYWYLVGILSPGILWLARKFPIDRQRWLRNLLIHIMGGGFFSIVHSAIYLFISLSVSDAGYTNPFSSVAELLRMVFSLNLALRFLTYALIVTISHAFDYYQRYREGELKASRLEADLASARLQALKMQLHPHFLFNTLHSISALVHRDAEAADRMIARLGDLLRLTLENSGAHEVSLEQELEFLDLYLEIQHIRFQDRLMIQKEIEPEALSARVPYLILQPIVENAIRHGIEPHGILGRIKISARRLNGSVVVEVEDNGTGPALDAISGNRSGQSDVLVVEQGIGLANTRTRLINLYGEAHRLELTRAVSGGLLVTMEIPVGVATSSNLNNGRKL